jgi:hypothetical protein
MKKWLIEKKVHSGDVEITWSKSFRRFVGSVCENHALLIPQAVLLDKKIKPIVDLLILGGSIRIINKNHAICLCQNCSPTRFVPLPKKIT